MVMGKGLLFWNFEIRKNQSVSGTTGS